MTIKYICDLCGKEEKSKFHELTYSKLREILYPLEKYSMKKKYEAFRNFCLHTDICEACYIIIVDELKNCLIDTVSKLSVDDHANRI